MRSFLLLSIFVVLSFGFSGCGGSGGSSSSGSDTSALTIAEQMTFVTVDSEGSSSVSANPQTSNTALKSLIQMATPTGGDYITDVAEAYVFDESMEVLSMINEVLCIFDLTYYDDAALVNAGTYLALLDESGCGKDRSGDENNESSASQTELTSWIVNSSRAAGEDHIVQLWTEEDGAEEGFDEIRAQLTISEGKSDLKPFGLFSMDFAGYLEGVVVMTGNLASVENADGLVEFELTLDNPGMNYAEQTHAVLAVDGSSGAAFVFRRFPSFESMGAALNADASVVEKPVQVAFNESYYLSDFGDRQVCRDAVNLDKNVWEYNLYTEDGARVEKNSGMPIRAGEAWGWADNNGIWLGNGSATDGQQVTSDDGFTTYTVVRGGGRVIKNTLEEKTLGDLQGDTFQRWTDDGTTYLVEWNGTNLISTGIHVCDQNGCTVTDIPDAAIVTTPNQSIGLWKQGLGSLDIVVPGSGVLTDAVIVPIFTEEFLTSSSAEFADGATLTLKCYQNCPAAPMTAALLNAGTPYLPDITDNDTLPYVYTITGDTMTLQLGGVDITIDDGVTIDPSSSTAWGFRTGAMIPNSVTLDNFWEAWSEDIHYAYESGPNSWNKATYLVVDGDAVTFENPLHCVYKDTTNGYGTVLLEYAGRGHLMGIPFERVEVDGSDFEFWKAVFTIADGTEITCDGTAHYTKAMSIEYSMPDVDASNCASLTTGSVAAPTNAFTDHGMGAAPDMTGQTAKVTPEGVVP